MKFKTTNKLWFVVVDKAEDGKLFPYIINWNKNYNFNVDFSEHMIVQYAPSRKKAHEIRDTWAETWRKEGKLAKPYLSQEFYDQLEIS